MPLSELVALSSIRQRHSILMSPLLPLRTALVQTINFIFPIEPLSPTDLLFTILGAPLPLPVLSSDPAPPLSLPSHPDVTEDTTATALGYVAQVVQLVSAYLGKGLVYPVTCCGSRSAIKDPISAMMGPRMFVLYLYNFTIVELKHQAIGFRCTQEVSRHIVSSMVFFC